MKELDLKKLLLGTTLMTGLAMAGMPTVAFAQTTTDAETTTPRAADEDEKTDTVVVTGSRIKRDEFSSISPIQVIDFDDERDLGLVDTVEILQSSQAAAGVQIDSAFSGFVLDNGPGSETIDLRGLGASRTLVLINDRRMAPAGVEGAPSQPSINLLPSSLVERVDQLLDGASSVYGSDAVAGVVNVVLRKDFEGLEISGSYDYSEQPNGNDYNLAAAWGKNYDRGFIGVGAEYDFRDALRIGDRDFLSDCETNYEIDENGQIRTVSDADQIDFDQTYGAGVITAADRNNPCTFGGYSGRAFVRGGGNGPGSIYFVEGQSNTGIPNFVDQTLLGVPIDNDNDGVQDYGFQQFNLNGTDAYLNTPLVAEQKRYSLMAFGEYTFEGDGNITPFFEVLHSGAETESKSSPPQVFPEVGPNNPFNPCGVNGVDCRGAQAAILNNAGLLDRFATNYEGLCARFGIPRASCLPQLFGVGSNYGPQQILPIFSIDGDRDNYEVSLKQTRLVGGFKGDMPFLNDFGSLEDWSFEASISHSFSSGKSTRTGIREDRLNFALGNDLLSGQPTGAAPCEVLPGQNVRADVVNGCVPVDLFNASVLGAPVGDFATQAERDYLFDTRDFDTRVKQTVWNAFATGTIAELPAGRLSGVVGVEYRVDEIDSIANDVARDGLLFGFFSDQGTKGKKSVREAFAELDIPLVADKPFFRQLDLNVSGRVLDDEYYGGAAVYSVKGGWRPVDSLLLKASYGTSYRSPNLRENFLGAQSGFSTVADPCYVSSDAYIVNPQTGEGVYLPDEETRDQYVLDRCLAEGIDPTTHGEGTGSTQSVEVFRVGNLELDAEESTSLTFGASFEQPFTDAFDLSLGVDYYDISVNQEVIEPSAAFAVNDCFVIVNDSRSPFCDLITRDANQDITSVDLAFINRDNRTVRGIDMKARFNKEFFLFDRTFDFTANAKANHILEVSDRFIGANGDILEDEDKGEFGFPDWTASLRSSIDYKDWGLSYGFNYRDGMRQDPDGVDEFGNVLSSNGVAADTCGGPLVGDVNCRDYAQTGSYITHNIGLNYTHPVQDWTARFVVGNVFDKEPPKVDPNEVGLSVSNVPIGAGYDFYGRRFFVSFEKTF